jgi:hypothetical protein
LPLTSDIPTSPRGNSDRVISHFDQLMAACAAVLMAQGENQIACVGDRLVGCRRAKTTVWTTGMRRYC